MAAPRIAILGAGNLGTTFALILAGGVPGIRAGRFRDVALWTIERDVEREIHEQQRNTKYLPGVPLPRSLRVTGSLPEALAGAAFVVFAVPSSVMREVARQTAVALRGAPAAPPPALVSAAKGLEAATHLRMSEVVASELPDDLRPRVLALSGPSIAHELSRGVPTAVVLACADLALARAARRDLQTPILKMQISRDVAGVELAGVLKNAYALALGLCDGLGLGLNTKAAILSRAVPEMSRLGAALGGKRATFFGLAGLGDLVGTGLSDHSRNRRMGEEIARRRPGQPLPEMPGVVEGLRSVRLALDLARARGLRVPILEGLSAVIEDGADPLKTLVRFVG